MGAEENLLSILSNNWKLSFGILFGIISLVATVENAVVLVTIYKYEALHTNINKILSSLAFADFLTGSCVALLFSLQLLSDTHINNATVNTTRRYLSTMLVGASVLTIAFISYDRSLHLRLLNKYAMSQKKLYISLTTCWLVPALIPLLRKVDDSEAAYSATIVVIVVLILLGIIFCYGIIFRALRNHERGVMTTYANERWAAKTVCIILTVFAVTVIPISIHHGLNVAQALPPKILAKTYIIGMWLCVASSILNPIVYYFRTPSLKEYIRRLAIGWLPLTDTEELTMSTVE